MQPGFALDRVAQAARPTLFDAAARPDLLIALTLANLMSPSLWDLKRRIHHRVGKGPEDAEAHFADEIMGEIHDYVNKKFYHVSPVDVAAIWGLLDLEEERARLGADNVNYTMDIILKALEDRERRGVLTGKQDVASLAGMGKFPEYEYSTVDVLEAHSLNMDKKHRPVGVSSCADEAALIAALACAEGGVGLADVAIFGSPIHYTTFVAHEHKGFWFNGKQEYHDSETWRAAVRGGGEEIQKAFDERIGVLERVITPAGFHLLPANECTMSAEYAQCVYDSFREFLGAEPRQIAQARRAGIKSKYDAAAGVPLIDLAKVRDAADVEMMVRGMAEQRPGSVYDLALYPFRSIHVARPGTYLDAALRGYRVRRKASEVRDVAHAIEMVRSIPGKESIFHTTDRIALPDEVLLFHTGSHRDKAVLLFSLIHHAGAIAQDQKRDMEVIFTERSSHVRIGGEYVNVESWLRAPTVSDALVRVRGGNG
ncbi:MAG: hypothetical protein AB1696_09470 [Planctomycetota bacterium]